MFRVTSLFLVLACSADPAVETRTDPLSENAVTLDDGLRAVPTPVPHNADPDRVVTVVDSVAGLMAGERVIEARRIGDAVVAIHPDHTLWLHEAYGRRRLDEHVEAPLSVEGSWVAYGRGEMPDFEIARLDVRTSEREVLTEGYAPAWNPALGPDGSVVFVSGRSGEPALYRVALGSSPVALESDGSFPSSLRAPRFDGVTLEFEDESGQTHRLAIDRAER